MSADLSDTPSPLSKLRKIEEQTTFAERTLNRLLLPQITIDICDRSFLGSHFYSSLKLIINETIASLRQMGESPDIFSLPITEKIKSLIEYIKGVSVKIPLADPPNYVDESQRIHTPIYNTTFIPKHLFDHTVSETTPVYAINNGRYVFISRTPEGIAEVFTGRLSKSILLTFSILLDDAAVQQTNTFVPLSNNEVLKLSDSEKDIDFAVGLISAAQRRFKEILRLGELLGIDVGTGFGDHY